MRLPLARLLLLVCALLAVVPAAANAATPPKVTSVAPLKLKIGERLTIRGKGFLAGKNRNTVLFKATGARAVFVKAESATSTVLVVKVPAKLAPFLKAASGTRFQLRVLARKLSPAYTPTGKSPVIASATSTAVGTSPATTPEKKAPSAAATLVPATPATTPPAPVAAAADCDGDGQPDTVDTDDDNDLLPDATEAGIFAISRVSGLNRPVATKRMPVTMKAPTACGIVKPLEAAISARPGVDQAVMTGILVRQESHRHSTTMARQIAVTPLAVSTCVAPTALAAAMTRASVPPKPTIAATKADMGMEMRIFLPCLLDHGAHGSQQHVEILWPRQAVVALGNER